MSEKKKLDHLHLAEGEATGHYHEISGAPYVEEYEDGIKEFELPQGGKLSHLKGAGVKAEHDEIALPAGTMQSGQVRVRDHFEEQTRNVQD